MSVQTVHYVFYGCPVELENLHIIKTTEDPEQAREEFFDKYYRSSYDKDLHKVFLMHDGYDDDAYLGYVINATDQYGQEWIGTTPVFNEDGLELYRELFLNGLKEMGIDADDEALGEFGLRMPTICS